MSDNFAHLFEESLKGFEAEQGSIVKGTVISIEHNIVLVDAGLTCERAIPGEQFKNGAGD
ncbi:30S ribosomal protein S1, partial [Pseudoalteromonas sp. S3785]